MVEEVPPSVVAKSAVDLTTNPEWRENGAGSTASEFAENPAFADPRMLDKFGSFVDGATDIAKFDFGGVAASGESKTIDVAKTLDGFMKAAAPYDKNNDGILTAPECRAFAAATYNKLSEVAPSLLPDREELLAAVDRVGNISTEQLRAIVQETIARADANEDGKVDLQECQNLLRVVTGKTIER